MKISEHDLHKSFAESIRTWQRLNKLHCLFWSYDASGEYRKKTTASLLKAKGLNAGHPDYQFITECPNGLSYSYIIYIEFKVKPNKQSKSQVHFQSQCKKTGNLKYYVCYSVEEAEAILKEWEIIKD